MIFSGYQVAGEGNLIPSQWDYLGEEVVDGQQVNMPCRFFGQQDTAATQRYWRYCFHYVSLTVVGSTETVAKLCLPARDDGGE
jgi:hypothetical protein